MIQMYVEDMTQFLIDILKRMEKLVKQHLWDDRITTLVTLEHAKLLIEKGGLAILDLEARNEAIQLMWLRAYLDIGNAMANMGAGYRQLLCSCPTPIDTAKRCECENKSIPTGLVPSDEEPLSEAKRNAQSSDEIQAQTEQDADVGPYNGK